jgi:hypothetical protein
MRTRLAATLAAAALLTLAACSSGSSHDDAAPTTPAATGAQQAADSDTAALVKSVTDYTAWLFDGNTAGYTLMSARCKREMSKPVWTALAKGGHQQYGSQKATDIHVDAISGDMARVTYGAGHIPQMDRKGQPWTREDGTWRWDACQSKS